MTIIQLVTRRQFRGAEVSAATLSEGLVQRGQKVFFVGLYKAPDSELVVNGAQNMDLTDGGKRFFSFRLLISLVRLFNKHRPAIVQANGSDTLKYAVLARFFASTKPSLFYRNISVMSTWVGNSLLKKKFNRFLLGQVNFITSVGEESRFDLISKFGVPENKIEVVRRGIPVDPKSRDDSKFSVCQSLGIDSVNNILIHIGHFSPEKNHAFLLEVFSVVKEKIPKASLLLVGDGDLKDLIERRAKTLGLKDVFFLGLRKDISSLLAASDVLLLTSNIEGVPGVVLEAAAQKTPSVAVNVGGISEVIVNESTGFLVRGHDIQEFAGVVRKILSDKAKREQLGDQAYLFVKQHFSVDNIVMKTLELYEKVIRV